METHNGLTDLNSLLATFAQTALDRDKLQQAIFSLQAREVYDANFSVITNSVRHFARHTFLLALEELSTSFITIMLIPIKILTIMCIFFCVCVCLVLSYCRFFLWLLYKCMLKFHFSKCITLFVSNNYADRCRLYLFCSAQTSSSCTTPPPHDHNVTTSNKYPNCTKLHLQKTMPFQRLSRK